MRRIRQNEMYLFSNVRYNFLKKLQKKKYTRTQKLLRRFRRKIKEKEFNETRMRTRIAVNATKKINENVKYPPMLAADC